MTFITKTERPARQWTGRPKKTSTPLPRPARDPRAARIAYDAALAVLG